MRKFMSLCMLLSILTIPSVGQAGLLDDLAGIVSGSGGDITGAALKRLQREAGYKALEAFMKSEGIGGARHFVRAIKAVVEYDDYGEATAAFMAGLDASGAELSDVIDLLYGAAIAVRLVDENVASEIISFIRYIRYNYRTVRGEDVVEKEQPQFKTPEKSWQTFIAGLQNGNWMPVASALVGYQPDVEHLKNAEKLEDTGNLKEEVEKKSAEVKKYTYSVEKTEDILEDLKALEIQAKSKDKTETFWALFKNTGSAWKLVGMMADISILKK